MAGDSLLGLPTGPLDNIAALLGGTDRLNLSHACTALHQAGRRWFARVMVAVTSALDAAGLAKWLETHRAPDGRPAVACLTAAGADCSAPLAGALSALSGQRIASLVVGPRTTLQLSALRGLGQLSSLCGRRCTLKGSPAAFSKLAALQSLTLDYCGLGHIPRSLVALTGLTHLELCYDRPSPGSLARVLPRLTALQCLHFTICQLEELPEGMDALTGLTCLELHNNMLSVASLARVLPRLTSLRSLRISACGLVALPEGLTALTGLTCLNLSDRYAPGSLESVLPHLSALQSLNMHACSLVELPAGIAALTGLTHLCLAGNRSLRGGWQHLRPLALLRELVLACASLERLPRDLTSLQALEVLDLTWVSPRHGWRHLLALPCLRRLVVGRQPPLEVLQAVPEVVIDAWNGQDGEPGYLSSDNDA